jgi:hypothetical protein
MKHLQIRLENEEHEAFRKLAMVVFGRDNLQAAGREAIRAWTAAIDGHKTKASIELLYLDTPQLKAYRDLFSVPDNKRLLDELAAVLHGGHAKAIDLVRETLEYFSHDAKAAKLEQRPTTASRKRQKA